MSSSHSPSTPAHRRQCYFSGRVQGVGFRYTVKNIAIQHNVSGYVRNLPDGRVELVLEGPDQEIDQVVDAVSNRMTGFIKKVDANTAPATGEFDYFQIRH
ncbi:MAG TPA: acylphosphatase [Tepidisphaeraceae bacterium]|nr:acylphosphatase [Tepidisphaeraceae bacterium]